jgi:hypothetical protein
MPLPRSVALGMPPLSYSSEKGYRDKSPLGEVWRKEQFLSTRKWPQSSRSTSQFGANEGTTEMSRAAQGLDGGLGLSISIVPPRCDKEYQNRHNIIIIIQQIGSDFNRFNLIEKLVRIVMDALHVALNPGILVHH